MIIKKLKVFILLIIMNQLRYDVMNPHNLYSLLVEKLLVHETGLTLFWNERNEISKMIHCLKLQKNVLFVMII